MSVIAFDVERRRVTVEPWSARVTWVGRSDAEGCSAMLTIRPRVHLLLHADDQAEDVRVELWSGEPEASDGLAVVTEGESVVGVSNIPICTCGERGCANTGLQLAAVIPVEHLPLLVALLHDLPDVSGSPRRGATWRGEFADGRPRVA